MITKTKFVKINHKISRVSVPEVKQATRAKVKALYFGANWAPTCRIFQERLIKFYRNVNAIKNIEEKLSNKKTVLYGKNEKILQKNIEICYYAADRD